MSGGVLIARSLWDDPAFKQDAFSEREAWVWMICEAAWRPHERRVGSLIIQLDRGQLAHSTRFLSEAFGWSHSKVRRFLERLENRHMIEVKTDTGVSVISLLKYNTYQLTPRDSGTAAAHKQAQQRHSSGTNKNKDNKEISNISSNDDGFDAFWQAVPQKKARAAAVKAYKSAVKKASPETILNGMKSYADSVKGKDPQYIAHPSTWLNQERWADEAKSADTRTWRDKPESEWTNKDRTQWAKAML